MTIRFACSRSRRREVVVCRVDQAQAVVGRADEANVAAATVYGRVPTEQCAGALCNRLRLARRVQGRRPCVFVIATTSSRAFCGPSPGT
jgi:hypothetical protein